MATRLTPISVLGAYTAESATDQLTNLTTQAQVLTAGVDYVVTLSKPIRMIVINDTLGAATLNVTSYPTTYGRLANISEVLTADQLYARDFKRVGWANGEGDLEFNVTASDCRVYLLEL